MINSKKAQSQLITTVLIILLVLAAVIIVWQLTQRTLSGGAEQVDRSANCMGVGVEVVSAVTNGENTLITLKRSSDSLGSATVSVDAVLPNGNVQAANSITMSPGEMKSVSITGSSEGEWTISSRLVFDDGLVCDGGTAKKTI